MRHLNSLESLIGSKDLDTSSLNLDQGDIGKSGLPIISFEEISEGLITKGYDQDLLQTLKGNRFNIVDQAIFFSQAANSNNYNATSLSFIKLYELFRKHILNIDAFLSGIYCGKCVRNRKSSKKHYCIEEMILSIFNNENIDKNQRFDELTKIVPERVSRYLTSKSPIGKTAINNNGKLYHLRPRDDIFCSILEKFMPITSIGGSNVIAYLLLYIYKCMGGQKKNEFKSWLLNNKKTETSDKDKAYVRAIGVLADSLMVSEYYMYESYSDNPNDSFDAIKSILLREDFRSYYTKTEFPVSYFDNNFFTSANTCLKHFFTSQSKSRQRGAFLDSACLQQIFQGPPGTGKSFTLKEMLKSTLNLTDEELDTTTQVERIVGHPELNSTDFIGSYRPITQSDKLEYSFTPGPFTRLLKKSLDSEMNSTPYILIIEELNRTNAAALFAEVFQLLDRNDHGRSEYATNLGQDVNQYLGKPEDFKTYLPANFAIWATMNTADQGVFPLDTAFKRRWSFKYLGVDEGQDKWWSKSSEWNPEVPSCNGLHWQEFRMFINQQLAANDIEEDRQLGGFFLSKYELNSERVKESIMTKVIGYLRDDVLRYEPHVLFKSNNNKVKGFGSLLQDMKKAGILSVFKGSPKVDFVRESIEEYVKAWELVKSDEALGKADPQSEEETSNKTSSEKEPQSVGGNQ